MKRNLVSRRDFLRAGTTAGIAASIAAKAWAQQPGGNEIRCGCIGVGGRGTGLLAEALNVEDVVFNAVGDINEGNLNRALKMIEEKKGNRPEGYMAGDYDYRNVLARDDIDAVIIATPCDWHALMYLEAMAAGKHFYGEKPMCISVDECKDILKAHKQVENELVCQIGFQRRANPRYIESIKLIHAGEIGELVEGRGAWDNAWGPLRGWFSKRGHSGDWSLEQACHTWDVFNWVAGTTPLRAYALGRNDIFTADEPDRDVHDYYLAIIEYPNRFTVQFHHSWFCPDDGAFTGVYERVAGPLGGCDLGGGRFIYRDRSKQQKEVGRGVNDTSECIRAFFDSIRANKEPVSGVHNGADAVMVGLLVRLAYDEEEVVEWKDMLRKC